jgi:hypothetical protein
MKKAQSLRITAKASITHPTCQTSLKRDAPTSSDILKRDAPVHISQHSKKQKWTIRLEIIRDDWKINHFKAVTHPADAHKRSKTMLLKERTRN